MKSRGITRCVWRTRYSVCFLLLEARRAHEEKGRCFFAKELLGWAVFFLFLIGTGVLHKGTWRLEEGISVGGVRRLRAGSAAVGSVNGTLVGGETST